MPTRISKTFSAYLGCENCGHEDTYEVPERRYITDFKPDEVSPVYSSYGRLDGTDFHALVCRYCHLPCLKVLWWGEREKKVEQEANRG